MGTRCNIRVINGTGDELWFYRHYDGYPQEVIPSLTPLMERLREGTVRTSVGQFSGWIIVLGNQQRTPSSSYGNGNAEHDWKVGHYEPTTCMHSDIAYLYTIDLDSKSLRVTCAFGRMPDEDIDYMEHTKTEIWEKNRQAGLTDDDLIDSNWLRYDTLDWCLEEYKVERFFSLKQVIDFMQDYDIPELGDDE